MSQQGNTTMVEPADVEILFIVGFGPIVRDAAASRKLYGDILRIPFKEEQNGYLHTEALPGARTFALWPLPLAAESCFGNSTWPSDVPVPQAWLEFDVADLEKASETLQAKGYRLLVAARKEPWGQIVSRFLSPEGLLVAVSITPSLRK